MAVPENVNKSSPSISKNTSNNTNTKKKQYGYGDIKLSLENCIMPPEILDVTPSMKDGLDRDRENDFRKWGCELIQVAGLLLRLPQTAMATGQVILQRFFYVKSLVHHDMETNAMAAMFLAAKIEECPRRLRDVINVCDHIKQKNAKKTDIAPMDYFSTAYFNIKNNVIKAERRILKELGFCVHVKHPHKIIITYLQILEHQQNAALARAAWNYMNDSLRTDVFVRFSPDIIACACIFLAARFEKINLPMKPPWWILFDASFDDIEEISLCILHLYSQKTPKLEKLELIVKKLKKDKKEGSDKNTPNNNDNDSFTPNSFTPNSIPSHLQVTNNSENQPKSKSLSKSASPVEKEKTDKPKEKEKGTEKNEKEKSNEKESEEKPEKRIEKRSSSNSINYKKMKTESDKAFEQEREIQRRRTEKTQNYDKKRFQYSSDDSSDSEQELPSKKYEREREQYETKKKRQRASSGSDAESVVKLKRSPVNYIKRENKAKEYRHDTKESNGKYEKNFDSKMKRGRSTSPTKNARRGRTPSPKKKSKYSNEKVSEKVQSTKPRHTEKYSSWR